MASLGDLLGVGDCHDSASVILGGGLTFAGDVFTFSERRDASLVCLGALACDCKTGIVSVVSDTWDFFAVITELLPQLKPEILARDGKLVIRPDSGDPVAILIGDPAAPVGSPEHRGLIELLWEIFGGTLTERAHVEAAWRRLRAMA